VAERFARGGIGQAGVIAAPFHAWIDEWSLEGATLSDVRMSAQGSDFSYDLSLDADLPFVPQGIEGYSVKSAEGQASHYYSQPFYRVSGSLSLPDGEVAVTGTAWLDREWSSQPLSASQTGWDWFSLALATGERLMGFRLRGDTGDAYTSATWIGTDGTPTPFADGAFAAAPVTWSQVAGRRIPTTWRVRLPARDLDVTVAALNPDAWMATSFAYWEGPVAFSGSHTGRGYLEMTGYGPDGD
jgi:predicted secreted hydrolase